MIGTRHSCIFEIKLEFETLDRSHLSDASDFSEDNEEHQTIIKGYKSILISKSHASQNSLSSKKLFFAHHPKLPILATIGDN